MAIEYDSIQLKKKTKADLLTIVKDLYRELQEREDNIEFLMRCQIKPEDRVFQVQTSKSSFAVNAEKVEYEGNSETGWLKFTKEGIGISALIPAREVISMHNVLAADKWNQGHNRSDVAKVSKEKMIDG